MKLNWKQTLTVVLSTACVLGNVNVLPVRAETNVPAALSVKSVKEALTPALKFEGKNKDGKTPKVKLVPGDRRNTLYFEKTVSLSGKEMDQREDFLNNAELSVEYTDKKGKSKSQTLKKFSFDQYEDFSYDLGNELNKNKDIIGYYVDFYRCFGDTVRYKDVSFVIKDKNKKFDTVKVTFTIDSHKTLDMKKDITVSYINPEGALQVQEHTVQFMVDGQVVGSKTVEAKQRVEPIQREGIEHWYEQGKNPETSYDFDNPVNGDLTLIGVKKKHTVSFEYNGKESKPQDQTIEHGKTATEPALSDVDYWYVKDGSEENKYDFATEVKNNIELVAKLKKKKQYKVEFKSYDGKEELADSQTVEEDSKAKKPEKTGKAAKVVDWYTKKGNVMSTASYEFENTPVKDNLILYGARTFTVALKYEGDNGNVKTVSVTEPAKNLPADAFKDFTDAKSWYIESDSTQTYTTQTYTTEEVKSLDITTDLSLVAKKAVPVQKVTVMFMTLDGKSLKEAQEIEAGTKIDKNTLPMIDENEVPIVKWLYKQEGTDFNNAAFDFSQGIEKDCILIAIRGYKVTLNYKEDTKAVTAEETSFGKILLAEKDYSNYVDVDYWYHDEDVEENRILPNALKDFDIKGEMTLTAKIKSSEQSGDEQGHDNGQEGNTPGDNDNQGNDNGQEGGANQEEQPNPPAQDPQAPQNPQPEAPNHTPEYTGSVFIEPIIETVTTNTEDTAQAADKADTAQTANKETEIKDETTPLTTTEVNKINDILDDYKNIKLKDIKDKGDKKLLASYNKAVKLMESSEISDKEIKKLYKELKANKKKYVKKSKQKNVKTSFINTTKKKELFALVKKLDHYTVAKYDTAIFRQLFDKYSLAINALNDKNISDKKLDLVYKNLMKAKKNADSSLKKNK